MKEKRLAKIATLHKRERKSETTWPASQSSHCEWQCLDTCWDFLQPLGEKQTCDILQMASTQEFSKGTKVRKHRQWTQNATLYTKPHTCSSSFTSWMSWGVWCSFPLIQPSTTSGKSPAFISYCFFFSIVKKAPLCSLNQRPDISIAMVTILTQ